MDCPVCGMEVNREDAPTAQYQGQTYGFCSTACKSEFERNPERYTTRQAGR